MKKFITRLSALVIFVVFSITMFNGLGGCGRKSSLSDSLQATLPEKVDFNFHIKPILSDRCFACHGPDNNKREANLRLDTEEGAFAALDSLGKEHAIVAGDLDESVAYQRIITSDPELMMPPPKSNLKLSGHEVALIAKWIEQGAQWKEHWSFIPPANPEMPKVQHATWVRNPVDQFVLSQLEQKGLQPNKEADKATLLRRVSFDLTGLPPSVNDVNAFLNDQSPNAYSTAVDRLLASPHYGERMAAEWMDVARYADSHGYQDDGMRNSWPWREWVIKAYNQNLPYNQFMTWQLAGDMLPNPTKEQLLATSFNRNHPQTQEGGVVDEEYRIEYVADRANTFGKAFIGLTVECARCHDHKYDPISQKDYYSLFAFFNNNLESGIIPYNGEASPSVILPSPEAESKLKFIREKLTPIEQQLNPENYRQSFESWLANAEKTPEKFAKTDAGLIGWFHFEEPYSKEMVKPKDKNKKKPKDKNKKVAPRLKADEFKNAAGTKLAARTSGDPDRKPVVVPGKTGNGRKFIGDAGMDFTQELNFERNQPFSISIWVNPLKAGEEGTLFAKSNGEFEGYRGYRCLLNKDGSLSVSLSYVWPANCIDLQTMEKLTPNQWYHIALTYDGSSKANGVKIFLNGKEAARKVYSDNLHKSLLHGEKKTNWSKMPFMLGKDFRGSIKDVVMDELMAYDRQLSSIEVKEINGQQGAILQALKTPKTQRTPQQTDELFEYYRLNYDKTYAENLAQATKLRGEENQLITDQPEVMVMKERKEVRPTFILNRGAYDAPTTKVVPNTPAKLVTFDKKLPKNRLGLAKWLTDPKNPLASRVVVNRFWAMCFGNGLVNTVDDFGNQGALPTNPALLDYLAVHFMKSGWDAKAFMKMLVTSATYRQSSIPTKKALELDPDNSLLSRGPSFRLSAEMIRDNALAASGLLSKKVGGPSVYPYQPAGIWEALATRNKTKYEQGHGEDLYRRSMYTVWKRSSPPPSMMNFDAPDRYLCTVRRQKTATPLQSLVLMNDPQYVEAARVLAERMMKEGGATPEARIDFAYKALTSRPPRPEELKLMKQLYSEELADFRKQPNQAAELLSTGEYKRNPKLNASEVAACTIIASTVMNFDEFVMKR